MALHTGVAEERDGDYFGQSLNRVARLLSAGHGGQTLLSSAAQELVRDHLPVGISLRDMGEHRLKDLIRPEHIFQVVASDAQTDFAPLKTLDWLPHNLPMNLTSFIGRDHELHDVSQLLTDHRMITLTGPGGIGKTRLSLHVAAEVLDAFPAGVWFIEFAPISDPALVPETLARVLGIREQADRALTDILSESLRDKTLLLIFDNCEHLVAACRACAKSRFGPVLTAYTSPLPRSGRGVAAQRTG